MPAEYVFVDEWDVEAPADAVFDAVADARTYPEWWRPVYLSAEADGPPEVGRVSRQRFKGRLPYTLTTRSTITRLERPTTIEADVIGDVRGRGLWTLTRRDGGTHVRFDWRVHADRPLLRRLTPVLRPLLHANHDWAIARAKEGLEPYARARAGLAPQAAAAQQRAIVQRLCDALNAHDLDGLVELFDEGYRSESPLHPGHSFVGREQLRRNWEAIVAAVPDVRAELLATAASADAEWSEWRIYGTKRDGSLLDLRSVWIVGVRGGRIAWGRLYRERIEAEPTTIDQGVQRLTAPEP